MRRSVKLLFKINPITFYLNFRLFPLRIAYKFPILILGRFSIHSLKGKVLINGPIHSGMIRIGELSVGIFEKQMSSVLNLHGNLIFNGTCNLGRGTSISIGPGAVLEVGNNLKITARSKIIASGQKKVVIGKDCLISWDVLIMNTDFHNIIDADNGSARILNEPKDIIIGERVWIGCNNSILKGVTIGNDIIIAAGSIVPGNLLDSNCIYGGIPAKKIKEGIKWSV